MPIDPYIAKLIACRDQYETNMNELLTAAINCGKSSSLLSFLDRFSDQIVAADQDDHIHVEMHRAEAVLLYQSLVVHIADRLTGAEGDDS